MHIEAYYLLPSVSSRLTSLDRHCPISPQGKSRFCHTFIKLLDTSIHLCNFNSQLSIFGGFRENLKVSSFGVIILNCEEDLEDLF